MICKFCKEPLEFDPDVQGNYISSLSGDEGGTYNICEANSWIDEDGNDHFGGHSPV